MDRTAPAPRRAAPRDDGPRLAPVGAAQRVATRALLAALLAASAELLLLRLLLEGAAAAPLDQWAFGFARTALLAGSIPLVARAGQGLRLPWRALLVVLCGACVLPAGLAAGAWAAAQVKGEDAWLSAFAVLRSWVRHPRLFVSGWLLGPLAWTTVYLLGSGITPRLPAPAVALVAFMVGAMSEALATIGRYPGLDARYVALSTMAWAGEAPALGACAASFAALADERLTLWLTARREARARRG